MQQFSFDEPPDYASEFDYRMAQTESEIRRLITAAAPVAKKGEQE